MKNYFKSMVAIALAACTFGFGSCSSSSDDEKKSAVEVIKKNDTALLLCSFGSTYMQPQETYDKIIADYHKKYPNVDIYMSFTSRTIINRVYAKVGKAYAQPDLWLAEIGEKGYKNVYVQSLHIIPGEEYLGLMNSTVKKEFMSVYPDVKVAKGACLLKSDEDVKEVAKILYDYYKPRLDKGEAVAFMGHGNPDAEYVHANQQYSNLEVELQKLSGKANIFVGTVDWGDKMFSHVRDGLVAYAKASGKENKDLTVTITPLMSIAGDHAQNDLLGGLADDQKMSDVDPMEDDEDAEFAWNIKLEKMGFVINPEGTTTSEDGFNVLGLGDHAGIRNIWVKHLEEAIEDMASWNDSFED